MSIINLINEKQLSILVFGDIMLDEFITGHVERVSPEAPVPVVIGKDNSSSLGGCGNVINNLINIGTNVDIISAVGGDKAGQIIREKLKNCGIESYGLLKYKEIKTTRKIRVIANKQHVVRVDWDSNVSDSVDKSAVCDIITQKLQNVDGVIISDYDKGFCSDEVIRFLIDSSKKHSKYIFVDPKGENWDKYYGATLITPNLMEAEMILGNSIAKNEEVELAGKKICDLYGIKTCIITRGSKGISVIDHNHCLHIPSNAREVFDVSGAGDTVIACLSSALLSGVDLIQAVNFANSAAGLVVGHVGTVPIRMDELKLIKF